MRFAVSQSRLQGRVHAHSAFRSSKLGADRIGDLVACPDDLASVDRKARAQPRTTKSMASGNKLMNGQAGAFPIRPMTRWGTAAPISKANH